MVLFQNHVVENSVDSDQLTSSEDSRYDSILIFSSYINNPIYTNFFNQGQIKNVSQALPHLFQMPLICVFTDLNNKKVASFILFIRQNQNINISILKMN